MNILSACFSDCLLNSALTACAIACEYRSLSIKAPEWMGKIMPTGLKFMVHPDPAFRETCSSRFDTIWCCSDHGFSGTTGTVLPIAELAEGVIASDGDERGDAHDWRKLPTNNKSTRQERTESFLERLVHMTVRSILYSLDMTDCFEIERELEQRSTKPLAHLDLRAGFRGKSHRLREPWTHGRMFLQQSYMLPNQDL